VTGAIGLLTLLQLAGAFVESHFGSSIVPGAWLTADSGWYWTILAGLIVLFTYVCNFGVILPGLADDQPSLAEQIKKKGFFVPSFRPGTATEDLFSRTILRISLFGGLGLALLAAGVPYLVLRLTHNPACAIVGTSGSSGERLSTNTTSARSFPALMYGSADVMAPNMIWTSFASSAR
jgi:preprotein translocase subunit SecY